MSPEPLGDFGLLEAALLAVQYQELDQAPVARGTQRARHAGPG